MDLQGFLTANSSGLGDGLKGAAAEDLKRITILNAAAETVMQFGFRRSSMQDIASRAGISRPALYLSFKNKDDIFTALLGAYFDATSQEVEAALSSDVDPTQALLAAFKAQTGPPVEALSKTPYLEELLSLKQRPGSAFRQGTERLVGVYARWIEAGVLSCRLAPVAVAGNGPMTARLMLTSLNAAVMAETEWSDFVHSRRHLAIIFGRALTPH